MKFATAQQATKNESKDTVCLFWVFMLQRQRFGFFLSSPVPPEAEKPSEGSYLNIFRSEYHVYVSTPSNNERGKIFFIPKNEVAPTAMKLVYSSVTY